MSLIAVFSPTPGMPGQIVGRVAFEPAIVGKLQRIEFEARAYGGDVVAAQFGDTAARREHGRSLVDDLQ